MGDHFLRNTVEDIDGVERDRDVIEDAFLEFMAGDGLAVATVGTIQFIDRQALFAIGAAIAILARDCIRASAFCAFGHAAQEVFQSMRAIEPVALPEVEQLAGLFLPALDALPQFVGDDAHLGNVRHDPFQVIVGARNASCDIAPLPAARVRCAFIVQRLRDISRRHAVSVELIVRRMISAFSGAMSRCPLIRSPISSRCWESL
ncbi:hypothetical protein ABVB72_25775 [Rhizobium nepotum]|uniref:hypothetical protein n=1 Tax=Rhizobium nepotum TaxID=1035271 RepID=UPI003369E861